MSLSHLKGGLDLDREIGDAAHQGERQLDMLVLGSTSYVRRLALTHNSRFPEGRSLCLVALFIALALYMYTMDM